MRKPIAITIKVVTPLGRSQMSVMHCVNCLSFRITWLRPWQCKGREVKTVPRCADACSNWITEANEVAMSNIFHAFTTRATSLQLCRETCLHECCYVRSEPAPCCVRCYKTDNIPPLLFIVCWRRFSSYDERMQWYSDAATWVGQRLSRL